jgi:hypothetical protein
MVENSEGRGHSTNAEADSALSLPLTCSCENATCASAPNSAGESRHTAQESRATLRWRVALESRVGESRWRVAPHMRVAPHCADAAPLLWLCTCTRANLRARANAPYGNHVAVHGPARGLLPIRR